LLKIIILNISIYDLYENLYKEKCVIMLKNFLAALHHMPRSHFEKKYIEQVPTLKIIISPSISQ
jgi:DNA integrity scanning protein DisA with diadenylate cyclase activity